MKIFILGLSGSGRTTVAKSLAEADNTHYVSAFDWFKPTFRLRHKNELEEDYAQEFMTYMIDRLKKHPLLFSDAIKDTINSFKKHDVTIIDGILNPKNFIDLFDYNKDIIVILNRLDNNQDCIDYDYMSVNLIKDYCFWLSSSGLLSKDRWIEYNFKLTGKDDAQIKTLGNKNTIYLVKSLNKAISHLKELLKL